LAGIFDGRGGIDFVDLSAMTTGVNLHLAAVGPNGFDAVGGTTALGGLRGFDKITASLTSKTDRLTGFGTDSKCQVKAGVDQSSYYNIPTGATLVFANFDELYGGGGADTFTIDFSAGVPVSTSGHPAYGGSC